MKRKLVSVVLLLATLTAAAQEHKEDSTDVFFRHLELGEVVVTGLVGDTRVKEMSSPITVVQAADLLSRASTNIISSIAREPGLGEITTGGGISKPVIRGLSYNRVIVVSNGIRQEGQQWGDEHGIEIDGSGVHSIEILKGPASLMYGSDALAGVIIFRPEPQAMPRSPPHSQPRHQPQPQPQRHPGPLRWLRQQRHLRHRCAPGACPCDRKGRQPACLYPEG